MVARTVGRNATRNAWQTDIKKINEVEGRNFGDSIAAANLDAVLAAVTDQHIEDIMQDLREEVLAVEATLGRSTNFTHVCKGFVLFLNALNVETISQLLFYMTTIAKYGCGYEQLMKMTQAQPRANGAQGRALFRYLVMFAYENQVSNQQIQNAHALFTASAVCNSAFTGWRHANITADTSKAIDAVIQIEAHRQTQNQSERWAHISEFETVFFGPRTCQLFGSYAYSIWLVHQLAGLIPADGDDINPVNWNDFTTRVLVNGYQMDNGLINHRGTVLFRDNNHPFILPVPVIFSVWHFIDDLNERLFAQTEFTQDEVNLYLSAICSVSRMSLAANVEHCRQQQNAGQRILKGGYEAYTHEFNCLGWVYENSDSDITIKTALCIGNPAQENYFEAKVEWKKGVSAAPQHVNGRGRDDFTGAPVDVPALDAGNFPNDRGIFVAGQTMQAFQAAQGV